MGFLDILILLAFVAYAISAGLRSRTVASKNLEEYFLAGRGLKGWAAGISMAATQFAADTPLLVTGMIATGGIFLLWRLWIFALAFLMMGFVLAASWRRARVLTDAELTELRYGHKPAALLRALKAVYFGTVINCTVLAMVLLAATRIAEPFLLWDQWLPSWMFNPILDLVRWVGVPLTIDTGGGEEVWIRTASNLISIGAIALVTTFYSATGGLRSVVRTDIIQFSIMMLGTLLYAVIVISNVGGLSALTERIHEMFASGGPGGIRSDQILAFTPSRAYDASWTLMLAFAFQWLIHMYADGTGYLAQRSMACRTGREAKLAAVVFTVAQIIFRSLLWLPIALGLLVLFPPDPKLAGEVLTAEREATFVRGMAELLPTGVKGLMLTGMLAALASTVDTHLNWGSSYWTNDIYKRFVCEAWLKKKPTGRTLVWVARGANVLILGLSLLIMTQLTSIQVAWEMSLLLGAGIGIVLVLRWLWWRMNAWGEIAAIGASLILAPILLAAIPAEEEALRMLLMAVGSTGVALVVVYLTGPEEASRLREFYGRAHPPGFWGPVAESFNEEATLGQRRLRRSIAATLLCAFSIFCLLTGLGSWLAGSPAPTWFPWRWLWILVLLAVGFSLVPLWWRLGFSKSGPQEG
jgi:Na+/proline symporter